MPGRGCDKYFDPGHESEDAADYQPAQDDEGQERKATFEKVRKDLEKSGADGEVLDRILKLLERQRLQTQKALSKMHEKESSRYFVVLIVTSDP